MNEDEIKAYCAAHGMTFLRWLNKGKGTFIATNNESYPTGGCTIDLPGVSSNGIGRETSNPRIAVRARAPLPKNT